jgi:hypothetical protein
VPSSMVAVAQSVRAPVCGTGGCEFKSRQSPCTLYPNGWRGGQVVRQQTANLLFVGSIPTRASVALNDEEAARSGLPTVLWGCSSAGRARRSQRRGQGFDPPQLHCVCTREDDGVRTRVLNGPRAEVAELVDAEVSKTSARKGIRVRVPSSVFLAAARCAAALPDPSLSRAPGGTGRRRCLKPTRPPGHEGSSPSGHIRCRHVWCHGIRSSH